MFGRRFELFKLFGFPIRVDLSWFIIVVLVTWSLAAPEVGLFAQWVEQAEGEITLSPAARWTMGLVGAFGLFASIVLHELGHALMARRHGLPMGGITLFIFGGVAEMNAESPSARVEFLVAIAGPVVSLLIAAVTFGLDRLGTAAGWPVTVTAVLTYLWLINTIVVAFNLLPAFPLDGGRVLRSALWAMRGSLRWATRITSQIGSFFGIGLIVLGVFFFVGGNLVSGIWFVILGLFLRSAAQMSYQQLLMRRALEGEPVRRFMKSEPVTVPASITVRELVEDYVYRHQFKLYPVVEDGRLRGCVTMDRIREVPREQWDQTTAGELIEGCTDENTIGPDADAMDAFSKMSRSDTSRLMVVEDGQLRGIIALRDLMGFISMKVELERE